MKKIIFFAGLVLSFLLASSNPHSQFTVDRFNVCSGTSLQLQNLSTGANAFEWIIEGNHYSGSFDTSVILTDECYGIKSIVLVATETSTGLTDTSSTVVEVFDTCYFHLTGDFLKCIGDTIKMPVFTEEIDTRFTVNGSFQLLSGCLTCSSMEFIINSSGLSIDRKSTYVGGCFDITTYHYLCAISEIDEVEESDIKIFPNPVSDFLRIENSKNNIRKVRVINSIGEILFEESGLSNHLFIDFKSYSQGIYFVNLQTSSGNTIIRKAIKIE